MLTFWLRRLLARPRAWRDALLFRWYVSDKGNLGYALVLPLPFIVLGLLVHFANADRLVRQAADARQRELRCLAENVYYEARGEPLAGQRAVAEVTLNRVASGEFPDTVCEVVHDKRLDSRRRRYVSAFSWTGLESMRRPRGGAWQEALEIATSVYDGREPTVVPGAHYYHSTAIEPLWAGEKEVLATIGNHVFYR